MTFLASASFTVRARVAEWHNKPILIEPRFFGQSLRDDLLAGEGCIFQATLPMGLRAAREEALMLVGAKVFESLIITMI